jgi:hypothetical protein
MRPARSAAAGSAGVSPSLAQLRCLLSCSSRAQRLALATRIVPRVTPRPPRQPSEILITYIQTDPQIASHLTLSPQKPTWQTIGDDALLERLSEAGKPAGLAYVDGRAIILFRNKAPPSNAVPHQFR